MSKEILEFNVQFVLKTPYPGIGMEEYPYSHNTFEEAEQLAVHIREQGYRCVVVARTTVTTDCVVSGDIKPRSMTGM